MKVVWEGEPRITCYNLYHLRINGSLMGAIVLCHTASTGFSLVSWGTTSHFSSICFFLMLFALHASFPTGKERTQDGFGRGWKKWGNSFALGINIFLFATCLSAYSWMLQDSPPAMPSISSWNPFCVQGQLLSFSKQMVTLQKGGTGSQTPPIPSISSWNSLHVQGLRHSFFNQMVTLQKGGWVLQASPFVQPLLGTNSPQRHYSSHLDSDAKPECLSPGSQTSDFPSGPQPTSGQLTHVDAAGRAAMVDVGSKPSTQREAVASAVVLLGPVAFKLVQENKLKKGDALVVAQLAGVQAAKLTSQLIPLCHHVALSHIQVQLDLDSVRHAVEIRASCRAQGPTGVEMEALTSAAVAALTLYDMCKAVSRDIVLGEIKLISKTGGQRGDFHRT